MRVASIDYLRGLCAFAIMIYHYLLLSKLAVFDSSDFLGRMGVYGVSIFYVLSGLTLFLVYRKRFKLSEFYIRRIFRIFPLLWVVMCLTLLIHGQRSIQTIILNFTGLFGAVRWWDYIGTGVWSIGNELVFYLAFPLIFVPLRRNKYWPLIMGLILYAIYAWFAFEELKPSDTLAEQWVDYINPLNQIALFFTGVILGYYFNNVNFPLAVVALMLSTGLAILIFYPTEGNAITLVTGYNRLIFTVACVLIILAFFKININLPVVDPILRILGEISYSVYLLHPIVWYGMAQFINFNPLIQVPVCVAVSLVLSLIVYRRFEKPFIEVGHILSSLKPQWNIRNNF